MFKKVDNKNELNKICLAAAAPEMSDSVMSMPGSSGEFG